MPEQSTSKNKAASKTTSDDLKKQKGNKHWFKIKLDSKTVLDVVRTPEPDKQHVRLWLMQMAQIGLFYHFQELKVNIQVFESVDKVKS